MQEPEKKTALAETALNQYLDKHELAMLTSYSEPVSFSAGDTILQQGSFSPGIYIILSGNASRVARTLESGITTVAILEAGDFMGEIGFLISEPSSTSIIARTAVNALFINKIYWNFLSAYMPELKIKIMTAIAKRICCRMKHTHEKIISYMNESNMVTRSILGKVVESLKKTTETVYQESEMDISYQDAIGIFSSFSKEEQSELLKKAKLIKAAKHCPIIRETDKQADCYVVLRGAVQSSVIHNNIIAKLSVIGPELFFCSVSMIDSSAPSMINYTTCEQVVLLKFPQAELEWIRENNKLLWDKFFNLICKSLVALEKSIQKLDIRLDIEFYNQ